MERLSWRRIGVEAVVVVASILMAFGIQAWWDGRSSRDLRVATLERLLADFEGTHSYLGAIIGSNQRTLDSHELLIVALEGDTGPSRVLISDTLLLAALASPTYNPPRASVEMALATGRLTALEDEPLRRLLAEWLQDLDDTAEDELAASEVVEERIVPLLASTPGLADVLRHKESWTFDDVPEEVKSSSREVERSDQLVGLLAVRMAHSRMALRGLSELIRTQERIADRLRSALARR